ncbi:MAG TPA: AAA family ATPase [Azospirillum sp.]|nr:AAA family ATPase [Azospirillum sp.]
MRTLEEADVLARLALDNPWWRTGTVEAYVAALPRRALFEAFFHRVNRPGGGPPLVLAGPRRVGKSVLIRQIIARLIDAGTDPRGILYVSLDAPALHGLPLDRLVAVACAPDQPGFLFLDGLHHLRDGEATVAALAAAQPSLRVVAGVAGGAAPRPRDGNLFVLPPLTFCEYLRFTGAERDLIEPMFFGKGTPMYVVRDMAALNERFVHYVNGGGFPEAVLLRPAPGDAGHHLRNEVLAALLHQDLPGLTGIASTPELNALLALLARNTGREVSIEAIAERAGIAKNTIRRYLDYLEASHLIIRMGRVHPEGGRFRRMRTFKVHLASPCLYAALFGPVAADDPLFPALAESAIIGQWLASADLPNLVYARLPEGSVDLVALSPDTGRPAWACALPGTDESVAGDATINGLIQFSRRNAPLRWIGATTRTQAALKAHDGVEVWHRPASQYCYEVGRRVAEEVGA